MDNKRHIIASDGMVLTNGEVFAAELWLGDGDAIENWREITEAEATELQESMDDILVIQTNDNNEI